MRILSAAVPSGNYPMKKNVSTIFFFSPWRRFFRIEKKHLIYLTYCKSTSRQSKQLMFFLLTIFPGAKPNRKHF